MHYFAALADRNLLHSTMKVYLSAITFHALLSGFPIETRNMHRLHYLLTGIRRSQGGELSKPRRAPISTAHMAALRAHISSNYACHDARMLWAAFTTAFFGLLRASEYTCPSTDAYIPATLLASHLTLAEDFTQATLRLSISKTDQFGKGADVHLYPLRSSLCPVSALVHYAAIRISDQAPLFIFQDGQFLTRNHVVDIIRQVFPGKLDLNTHSFRIGGASALAAAGVPDYIIRIMGRWASDSFLTYIRIPAQCLRDFHNRMARQFPL